MRVLVAGGTGTIGLPLVRALVAAGHEVAATTRAQDKAPLIRAAGATPVVVDALDAAALERAVREAAPSHVIHELTALPTAGPRRAADLAATNRLRDAGTRNLLHAAVAAGARRMIVGSFAPFGAGPDTLVTDAQLGPAAHAVRAMEDQVIEAARRGLIEGIVLRYGLFYGRGTSTTDEMLRLVATRRLPVIRGDHGRLPFIHLDDAVAATVAAIDRGISGRVYDVVDDCPVSFSEMVAEAAKIAGAPRPFAVPRWLVRLGSPYLARTLSLRVAVSNAAAREDFGWAPAYSSYREGMRATGDTLGPVERFLAADHRRLEALLGQATRVPGQIDPVPFAAFREGLLRHIGMEEKVLLPAATRARGGDPHPRAARLRLDHGAIAALLVPTPTPDLVATLRLVLETHDAVEEGPQGVYADCDCLLAVEVHALLDELRRYPPVRVAPHHDSPLAHEHIKDALARARATW